MNKRLQSFHKQQIRHHNNNTFDNWIFYPAFSKLWYQPQEYINWEYIPWWLHTKKTIFEEAKRKELKLIWERSASKFFPKSWVPENSNTLGGHFVLSIKDEGKRREVWKARLFVQVFRNKAKSSLVSDSTNAKHHSIRILVGLASVFGFMIFSTYVTQAHLQFGLK